jgi:DnaJ like chaperone protein
MRLQGKIGWGLIGMLLGGLLRQGSGMITGFVIGSLLGHWLVDKPRDMEEAEGEMREYKRKQGKFIFHAMTLCAKIAKSDGPINRNEVNFAERLMRQHFRLNDTGRKEAIRIWTNAKNNPTTFDEAARAFYADFGQERYQINNMMDLLFAIVAADGGIHPREEELLFRAAGAFRISRLQYERIKARYYHQPRQQDRYSPLDPYYALLGADTTEPTDSIKKKYRALAMKWHPDTVASKGASTEAQRHAKEKFQQINEAYERILEARKV